MALYSTRDIKHIAYNTLVRPTLEYCSTVWDPHTRRNIDRLEQINTKAARFTTNNYTQAPSWHYNTLKTTNKRRPPSHTQTSTQTYTYVQNHKQ